MIAALHTVLAAAILAGGATVAAAPPAGHPAAEILGTWRGTSICTDRTVAPACRDETVVYTFSPGNKPGAVRWTADKIVNGERQTMGELDMRFDSREGCWLAEFSSPSVQAAYCLKVSGTHMAGTGWVLPGRQTIRKIEVSKD